MKDVPPELIDQIVESWRQQVASCFINPKTKTCMRIERAYVAGCINTLQLLGYTGGMAWLQICSMSGRSILEKKSTPSPEPVGSAV